MSNKGFAVILAIIIAVSVGFIAVKKKNAPPETPRPGTAQPNKGAQHVADGTEPYGGPEPPTSGNHAQSPLPWQVYDQEVPDMSAIHNMEHGGIYISYRPDLPADQIAKIKSLFGPPYSRKNFTPTKAIVAPRAANSAPIIMSSWDRNMKLNSFDEEKMLEYYRRNIGQSPEPTAG